MNRAPVTSLHPLSKKQADWLYKMGERLGHQNGVSGRQAWWVSYFEAEPDDYENPFADVSSPQIYTSFVRSLELALNQARTDRNLWVRMKQEDAFPPEPPRSDPYGVPAYLGWWQTENAFRRGYKSVLDQQSYDRLKRNLKDTIDRDGGVLTAEGARSIARSSDEFLSDFFDQLSEQIERDDEALSQFGTLREMMTTIWVLRERAYQQFSPQHFPLTSRGGGGFFGVDPIGSRR